MSFPGRSRQLQPHKELQGAAAAVVARSPGRYYVRRLHVFTLLRLANRLYPPPSSHSTCYVNSPV